MREGDWRALAVCAACGGVSFVVVYLVCWAVS